MSFLDDKFVDGGDVDSITLSLVDKDGKEFEKQFHFPQGDGSWIQKKLHPSLRAMLDEAFAPRVREDPEDVLSKVKEEIKGVRDDLLDNEKLSPRQVERGLNAKTS